MNKRRIISVLIALVLAAVGTVLLVRYVQSVKDDAVAAEALVEVYVIDEFVPQGADVDAVRGSLRTERVPARLVQPGTVADLTTLDGLVASGDLQPGDQLVDARLTAPDAVGDDADGKVQIAAKFEAERAVGGVLRPGDLVGVYLSFEPFDVDRSTYDPSRLPDDVQLPWYDPYITAVTPKEPSPPADDGDSADTADDTVQTPNITHLEFQHALVTNVQTVSAPVTPETDDDAEPAVEQVSGTQYVVTIALSPEESERFVFAQEFGTVWLSLDPADVADDGTRPVTLGNVYEVSR